MNNLFGAFTVFGRDLLDGTVSSTILLVIFIELILLIVDLVALLIVVLVKRGGGRRENDYYVTTLVEPQQVTLKELQLDTSAVRKFYFTDDEFSAAGLIVTAVYSDGTEAEITDYELEAPSMATPGQAAVTVRYMGASADYDIVVEQKAAQPEPEPERALVSIETDVAGARTVFAEDEPFSHEGLVVTAHYSAEPVDEQVEDYTVDEPDMTVGHHDVVVSYGGQSCSYSIVVEKKRTALDIVADASNARTVFVVGERFVTDGLAVTVRYSAPPYEEPTEDYTVDAPDMSTDGDKEVTVHYGELRATYAVTVVVPEKPEVPESEYETSLRYDRSFTARLIQSDDDVKQWYNEIKNDLLSYKKIKDRMSWKKESYRHGRDKVAMLGFRGKSLCLFLALDPAGYAESKYKVEDVSDNTSYVETPLMYRIKNDRRARYAKELIAVMMENMGIERIERESQDYYLPYEGLVELIEKGLVRRNITATVVSGEGAGEPVPAPVALEAAASKMFVVEEESVEGGVLRYDRSFTARLIQSDDDVKQWYGEIKNDLLSYKKVKDRMSWKKETYRQGKDKVALIGFRGKSLCLFLALDPANYAESKYKVEDAGANSSYSETPLMYRIKNDKRAKYAKELIAEMMEERGVERTDREPQDYYMPSEGILELIEKGLIRRDIKTSAEEGLFRADAEAASTADAKDYSFRAKISLAGDDVRGYYNAVKNELLSYGGADCETAWTGETYTSVTGGTLAAVEMPEGELHVYLALDPSVYDGAGYAAEDASGDSAHAATPLRYIVRSDRDVRLIGDLVADLMHKFGLPRRAHTAENYAEPKRTESELTAAGLINLH